MIERNYQRFGSWDKAFTDPLELMIYALNREEDKYMAKVRTMDKEAVGLTAVMYGHLLKAFCVDYAIYDILGEVYMNIASRSKGSALGQYFTPFHLCEAMAHMTLGDIGSLVDKAKAEGRRLSIMDPCVGSGAMLLAAKKVIIEEKGLAGLDHFEFYGQDIDRICVDMCKVQMTMTNYRYMTALLMTTAYELQQKMKAQ